MRAYVRTCVRPSRCCWKTVHYFFSETLQLVRACKCEKNVPSAYLKKFRFRPFWPKTSKIGHFGPKCPKMEVFRIFIGIPSLLFSETLQLIRAFKCDKNDPIAFLKKFPFCPFWPKIVQNWPFGLCARVSLRAGNR